MAKGLGLGAAAGDGQEVEVAAGALVQREEVAGVADIEGSDVGEVAAELVADVVEECTSGADPLRKGALAAVTLQGVDVELVGERVGGLVDHEAPGVGGGEGAGDGGGKGGGEQVALVVGHHGLAGSDAAECLDEGGLAMGVFHGQGAGGELERGNAIGALTREDCGDVVRGFSVEEGVFGEGAGGDDAGDLAADEPLGGLGVFSLLADGGLESGADDLGQVVVERVVGYAAHGHTCAFGDGHAENGGRAVRVLKEHLVEVAHPKEEDGVRVEFFLRAAVLPHHRCQAI